ncbi:MAG: LacI family DNA-binding transcriptional regulator [Planctomycetes bacterium]|nr:LacI family DNA-binding transcriptional regulator [Planctomycetota bacterium]
MSPPAKASVRTALRPRVTMTSIARASGVSQTTVSMVLTGRAKEFRIHAETADKVWAAAHRLGYRMRPRKNRSRPLPLPPSESPSQAASAAGPVAVVFVEYRGLSGDILYSPAYLGLCRAATGHEIRPFGGMKWEGLQAWARSEALAGCKGLVLFTHRDPSPDDLAPIANLGIPWILMNRDPQGCSVPRVLFDAYGMAYGLIEELLKKGHAKIAALGTDRTIPSAAGQRNGYRDALIAAGCYDPDLVNLTTSEWGEAETRAGVKALLERRPDTTAIYAFFDWHVQGLYQGIRDTGRRVPDDVSVVATGGQPVAQRVDPVLTTIRYPMLEMGEAAFRLLERIWRGESVPERTVIPGELLPGASVAPALTKVLRS